MAGASDVFLTPGVGLLVRLHPIMLLLPSPTTTAALGLLRELETTLAAGAPTIDDRAWRAVNVLRRHAISVAAFGAAVQLEDRYLLLVRGAVTMVVSTPEGHLELDGRSSRTWVDRVVPEPISVITARPSEDSGLVFTGHLGRRDGHCPAAGFIAYLDAADAAGAASAASAAEIAGAADAAGAQIRGPEDEIARRSTQVIHRPPPPRAPAPVTGVYRQTCRALVADDGTRVLLDRDYVFGRSPFRDPSVVAGNASPLVVQDPDHLVSRVQLHLGVQGERVIIRDSGSANGTYFAEPGAEQWRPLNREPMALLPGWSIRLGRRVYTYVIE